MRSALALVVPTLFAVTAVAAPPDTKTLEALQAQYAPVELKVDLTKLPPSEQQVVAKLVQAAKLMDGIYLRQVWAGNPSLLVDLARDASPLGRARLRYFIFHKGPWDRADGKAFLPGVPDKQPPSANFYPADAKKEEIEAWMNKLPKAQKATAQGFYTTIRRGPDGKLTQVPYSVEYQGELAEAARLLDEAAALTQQPTLKKFLSARAAAFRGNDYYASEVAWMELDSSIEPTIGPYETYEDGWFSYKAAFEAYITVRDDAETQKLAKFSAELQGLEDKLPIDPRYRNKKLGALAPIKVVNQVYASGDGDRGVKTAAYNLPNDERVTREKGSKRTMLKNVQEAKFEKTLVPIARVALSPAAQKNIDFDAFFTFVLMHELMHGLGPNEIVVGGEKTTPRKMLKELYSASEEAKADISGLWALQQLIDKGTLPKEMQRTMYDTYLAGVFRTLRFGVEDAHGKGMVVQLAWLLDKGGIKVAADGTFAIDEAKIREAVTGLTTELMTLQATGDHAGMKKLFDAATVRPEVQKVIDKLKDVPVDIDAVHVTAAELLRQR